jgi:hypothetical protein
MYTVIYVLEALNEALIGLELHSAQCPGAESAAGPVRVGRDRDPKCAAEDVRQRLTRGFSAGKTGRGCAKGKRAGSQGRCSVRNRRVGG